MLRKRGRAWRCDDRFWGPTLAASLHVPFVQEGLFAVGINRCRDHEDKSQCCFECTKCSPLSGTARQYLEVWRIKAGLDMVPISLLTLIV